MSSTKEHNAAYMRKWRKANPEWNRESQRRWRLANPERLEKYKEQNRRYRQTHKKQIRIISRRWEEAHRDERRLYTRQVRQARKIKVLTHYGHGKLACVECKEARLACLSIDHINGGGTKHRKSLPDGGRLYPHLIKWGLPEGYQTLCMNCQFVKRDRQMEYGNFHGSYQDTLGLGPDFDRITRMGSS